MEEFRSAVSGSVQEPDRRVKGRRFRDGAGNRRDKKDTQE